MASSHHSLPSPDISDVMNLLSTMKKQNEEILAKNEEILAKLNAIEEDNQKLRQELHEIKTYHQKHNYNVKVLSGKRDEPEDEAEHKKEPSNSNKKARVSVSVMSLPPEHEPEHILEPPASFNTLDDDCLGNVLDFVGKKCYSVFGRVNKRCHEMFCSKGLKKETYLYGYGPLHLILQKRARWYYSDIAKGVLQYNRRDILDWLLTDESDDGYRNLKYFCYYTIQESVMLREVFDRANERQLTHLRYCERGFMPDLCCKAAQHGKLECLKFLRQNECEWNDLTWFQAKREGHEHILEYLRNNGYPTGWQN